MKAVSTGAMLLGGAAVAARRPRHARRLSPRRRSRSFSSRLTTIVLDRGPRSGRSGSITSSRDPNWRSWLVWGAWFLAGARHDQRRVAAGGLARMDRRHRRAGRCRRSSSRCWRPSYTGLPLRAGPGPRSLAGAARRDRSDRAVGRRRCRRTLLPCGAADRRRAGTRSPACSAPCSCSAARAPRDSASSRTCWRRARRGITSWRSQTIRRGAYAPALLGRRDRRRRRAAARCSSSLSIGVRARGQSALVTACVLALAGGAAWDYIWVEAGQSVPLS